jgi:hypothetical protein
LTLETDMKIELKVELDTESEQDVQLIEKVVALVDELKEQLSYEDEG